MAKQRWKPGTMIYPVPAVMVTVADREGRSNIITVAWTGTICTNPPMAYISVRPERHSYKMLKETEEFVINMTTEELAFATDYCGVKSGRNVDKWKETGLTREKASVVGAPLIKESPINIECRVTEIKELGSHHMFLAQVVAVDVNEDLLNERQKFELHRAKPIVYSHGEYYGLSHLLGTFGYSVKKGETRRKNFSEEPDTLHNKLKPSKRRSEGAQKAGGFKKPESFKKAEGARKPEDFKKAEGARKPEDFKKAQGARKPGGSKKYEGARKTEDFKKPENSPKAEGYKKPKSYKKAGGYRKPKAKGRD